MPRRPAAHTVPGGESRRAVAHGGARRAARDRPLHVDAVPGDKARTPLPHAPETPGAGALPAHHRRPGRRVLPAALGAASRAAAADAVEPRLSLPGLLPRLSRPDSGATRGLVPT